MDWLCSVVSDIPELRKFSGISGPDQSNTVGGHFDLLELYCGNGNHTVALAPYVRRIVAVELNKTLCDAANENLRRNHITNARIVACDSGKFANRILRSKRYFYKPKMDKIKAGLARKEALRCAGMSSNKTAVSRSDSLSDLPRSFIGGAFLEENCDYLISECRYTQGETDLGPRADSLPILTTEAEGTVSAHVSKHEAIFSVDFTETYNVYDSATSSHMKTFAGNGIDEDNHFQLDNSLTGASLSNCSTELAITSENRYSEMEEYSFGAVLVDPPRAGWVILLVYFRSLYI